MKPSKKQRGAVPDLSAILTGLWCVIGRYYLYGNAEVADCDFIHSQRPNLWEFNSDGTATYESADTVLIQRYTYTVNGKWIYLSPVIGYGCGPAETYRCVTHGDRIMLYLQSYEPDGTLATDSMRTVLMRYPARGREAWEEYQQQFWNEVGKEYRKAKAKGTLEINRTLTCKILKNLKFL